MYMHFFNIAWGPAVPDAVPEATSHAVDFCGRAIAVALQVTVLGFP